MKNCSIRCLKGAIDNSNLIELGYGDVEFTDISTISAVQILANAIVDFKIKNATFAGGGTVKSTNQITKSDLPQSGSFVLSVPCYSLQRFVITNNTGVKTSGVTIDISRFVFSKSLESLRLPYNTINGKLSGGILSKIASLDLYNCKGNIKINLDEYLASIRGFITTFDNYNKHDAFTNVPGFTGDMNDFITKAAAISKAGRLNIEYQGTNIIGEGLSKNIVINFDGQGGYTIS